MLLHVWHWIYLTQAVSVMACTSHWGKPCVSHSHTWRIRVVQNYFANFRPAKMMLYFNECLNFNTIDYTSHKRLEPLTFSKVLFVKLLGRKRWNSWYFDTHFDTRSFAKFHVYVSCQFLFSMSTANSQSGADTASTESLIFAIIKTSDSNKWNTHTINSLSY